MYEERYMYYTNIQMHMDFRMRTNWDKIPGLPTNSCTCLPSSSLLLDPNVMLSMNPQSQSRAFGNAKES